MTGTKGFPEFLRRYLAGFIARRRAVLAARAIGYAAGLVLGWILIACLLDRLLQLPESARWVGLAIGLSLAICGVAVAAWHVVRSADWNAAAARIESRAAVFDERLQTATSRLLDHDARGTSPAFLQRTLEELTGLVASVPIGRILPWRRALGPWAWACAAALVLWIAALVPSWHFDLLLARALFPHRPVDPVTVHLMRVSPKNIRVSPGETLTVSVDVAGSWSAGVDLYLSADGRSWSRAEMNATSAGHFEFPIPSVERDLRYYVRAGETRSDVYSIQVHRVPGVVEFRIRYDYPAYANHGPASVTNTDGSIECLANSTATVTVVATDPLAAATWVLGGDRLPMTQLDRPQLWQVSFPVVHNESAALEMVSAAGVAGNGPSPMPVRAVPDEAPRPAIILPAADVRLQPGDTIPVRFVATDDYGLHALDCQIRVNGRPIARATVPLSTRPLRREAEFTLDLSSLAVSVGDVVTLIVEAEDEWRQSKFSEGRTIFVAPTAAPPQAYELADELDRALELSRAWENALAKVRKAVHPARPRQDRQVDPVSAAGDAALLLRQSLLRAVILSDSPALTDALAGWIDQTEDSPLEPHRAEALSALARSLTAALKVTADGRRAAALQPDWRNYVALSAAPPRTPAGDPAALDAAELHAKAIAGLKKSLDEGIASLSLAESPQLESQLEVKVSQVSNVVRAVKRPDWLAASQRWVAQTPKPLVTETAGEFSARLEAASQVESLRPDANPVLARDLDLASRALRALVSSARPGSEKRPKPQTAPSSISQFDTAFKQILTSTHADVARASLRALIAQGVDGGDVAEHEALDAAAAAARGQYDSAAAHDAKLAQEVAKISPEQSVRLAHQTDQSLSLLRELEALQVEQDDLQKTPDDTAQRRLAEKISTLHWPIEAIPVANTPAPVEAEMEFDTPPRATGLIALEALAAAEAIAGDRSQEAAALQGQVVASLKRAAVMVKRAAALTRFSQVPSFSPLFPSVGQDVPDELDRSHGWAKEWQHIGGSGNTTPTPRDAAAARLDDQLRAYYQSISKANQPEKK